MESMDSPVLFVTFNRPSESAQVLARIREARPSRLYLASDGPRRGHPADVDKVGRTREAVLSSVDWTCTVKTLFREENLGCARAVAEAIDWFFDHEEEGIILEDDCLPDPTFFRFCAEVLERYRDNPAIGHVGGNTFHGVRTDLKTSYYFSALNHIWGWATWKRAWALNDPTMREWPAWRSEDRLFRLLGSRRRSHYWEKAFEGAHSGSIASWGYAWTFACWEQGLISVLPRCNLVRNIGFGADATHTRSPGALNPARESYPMKFPLVHPDEVRIDCRADKQILDRHFRSGLSLLRFVRKLVARFH